MKTFSEIVNDSLKENKSISLKLLVEEEEDASSLFDMPEPEEDKKPSSRR